VREYTAVYGCVRALTTAVVAVTVAVGDTSGPPASQAGSRIKAGRRSASLALPYSFLLGRPLALARHLARSRARRPVVVLRGAVPRLAGSQAQLPATTTSRRRNRPPPPTLVMPTSTTTPAPKERSSTRCKPTTGRPPSTTTRLAVPRPSDLFHIRVSAFQRVKHPCCCDLGIRPSHAS
jgi:hypothetical protein